MFITALNDGLQNADSGNYRKTINIPTLSIPSHAVCMALWTWDLGYTVYREHMLSGINGCLNPLAFPSGYLYPIFIFICVFLDSLFSLHTKVYGFTVMPSVWEQRWHALSRFDSVSMDNLRVSWILFNLLTIMAYI